MVLHYQGSNNANNVTNHCKKSQWEISILLADWIDMPCYIGKIVKALGVHQKYKSQFINFQKCRNALSSMMAWPFKHIQMLAKTKWLLDRANFFEMVRMPYTYIPVNFKFKTTFRTHHTCNHDKPCQWSIKLYNKKFDWNLLPEPEQGWQPSQYQ